MFRTAYQQIMDSLETKNFKTSKHYKISAKNSKDIKPNYIYLRFNPKNKKQVKRLLKNKKFTVRNYPFEYETLGDYQLSNNDKISKFDSYFTSVPIDLKLPNIPYTTLQEMYLPEKDPKYNNSKSNKSTAKGIIEDEIDVMNHVLELAFKTTSNEHLLPEPILEKNQECTTCIIGINLRSRWYPSGKLQIFDLDAGFTNRIVGYETVPTTDYSTCADNDPSTPCPSRTTYQRPIYERQAGKLIPIAGVEVVIRDTWTLDRATTNAGGNFRHKRVRAKVRYVVRWENSSFRIKDGTTVFLAEDKGPKLHKAPWNLQARSGRIQYRAQIYMAAHWFYKSNIGGLSRPQTSGMEIAALNNSGVSYHAPEVQKFFGPTAEIGIARLGQSTEDVFGTTIHELGHSVHRKIYRSEYDNLVYRAWILPSLQGRVDNPTADQADARRVLESFATGVEIYVSNLRYRRFAGSGYNYLSEIPNPEGQYQNRATNGIGRFYTSVVHDLNDNFNQRVDFGRTRFELPLDRVNSIPVTTTIRAFKNARTWNGLRLNVIRESGANTTQINELFNNW